ncbi:MAG: nucleoside triphosphate pyrophosphohydrolase [Bacteroidales bacterium]|nr:nucleoside triphosphate pyrophosphohydrolase [Bacteroidales bacterium]
MDARTIDAFTRLSDTLDRVRKECPWDKVQTIQSLRYLTIEEVYELSEAIVSLADNGGNDDFKKELGDLFMHLMFYSKIAEEEGRFSLADVLNAISDKLVARHPHIFSPDNDQHQGWEQLKMKEGRKSAMEGVPTSLPSLNKAVRIQEKAAGMGFDFSDADEAFAKVKEEYQEFEQSGSEEEFGDLLFAIVKWGAMRGINADDALGKTNRKFIERFRQVEQAAANRNKTVSEMTKEDMLQAWREAK